MSEHAIQLRGVTVVADGRQIVEGVDWSLPRGAHVVVLGPNGAGKTTLLRLAAGYQHPHQGTVDVLGRRIGRCDVRRLRRRLGIVSDGLGDLVDRRSRLRPLVAAALHGMTTERGAVLDDEDLDRAAAVLRRLGVDHLADRPGTSVSEGEWKRTLLARALVADPDLLLLDEPFTGLDLAERERLLAEIDRSMAGDDAPTTVLVTHHLEHVPAAATHGVLVRDARLVADGPVDEVLTDALVSRTFGIAVRVTTVDGRRHAVMRTRPTA